MVTVTPQCVLWSFGAQWTFGLTNFLLSYSNESGVDSWAVIGLIWLASGFSGIFSAVYFWMKLGKLFFTQRQQDRFLASDTNRLTDSLLRMASEKDIVLEADESPVAYKRTEIPFWIKVITIVGGLCVGFSQLMMKMAFATDPESTGPLTAVISSDILVIGLYSHYVYRELLAPMQVVAIFVVLTGLLIMALMDSAVGHLNGFFYAILGMLSFAASIIIIRTSAIEGLSANSGFIGRMGAQGVLGIITVGWAASYGAFSREEDDPMMLYFWPIVAGISQALGVFFIQKALQYPSTGIVNVIAASNSIVVLLLSYLVLGLVPSFWKTVGMGVVVSGVALITLYQPAHQH